MDQKKEDALKSNCEKVDQTYSTFVSVDKTSEQKHQDEQISKRNKGNYRNNKSFRAQGIKEDPNKSKVKNLVLTHEKRCGIMYLIGATTEVKKPQTI